MTPLLSSGRGIRVAPTSLHPELSSDAAAPREPGDVEAAINSANAIGDDRLQRRAGGFVHPEKFTHGTSAQRVRWFTEGLRTGDTGKARLDHFFKVRSSRDL